MGDRIYAYICTMTKDTTIDEFRSMARLVKVGDDMWDVYADLLIRKQSLYVRRAIGVNEEQALLDAYKEVQKVFNGDKSPRVFVKNNPEPVLDIENSVTFTPVKNTLWQKSQDQIVRSPSE